MDGTVSLGGILVWRDSGIRGGASARGRRRPGRIRGGGGHGPAERGWEFGQVARAGSPVHGAKLPAVGLDECRAKPSTVSRPRAAQGAISPGPARTTRRMEGGRAPRGDARLAGVFDLDRLPALYRERLSISWRLVRQYRPGQYRGHLTLLRCQTRPLVHRGKPDLGLGRLGRWPGRDPGFAGDIMIPCSWNLTSTRLPTKYIRSF